MRYDVGRFRRPMRRSTEGQLMSLISLGDGSTLSLDFTTGVLDPRLTFTRDGGGTYTGNDGLVYGMDFATSSSLAIGTGSKSVTLTATASVDRRYLVGQTVWISNGANNMRGPVTAYNASTQVLTINATATSGSGSFTSWTVGNASARFDHDPTTLAPRGLLIEGAATNIATNSNLQAGWLGGSNTTVTANTNEVTSPDGTNNAAKVALTNAGYCSRFESITGLANATTYTFSYWIRGTAGNQQRVYSVTQGTDLVTQSNLTYTSTGWTRVQITFTSGATNNNVYIYVASRPTGTVNDVLYIWGAQLEVGSGASSHIPTGASQGSRGQDLVSITTTNFSSWWTSNNPASFLVDISSTNRPLANHIFRIADSSGSAYGYQSYFNSTTMPMQVRAAMSSTASSDIAIGSNLAANTRTKIGFTVETASLKRFRDGSLAHTLATPTLPPNTLTQMYIGGTSSFGNSSADFHIRQFKYWPITLSDAAMQGFTT